MPYTGGENPKVGDTVKHRSEQVGTVFELDLPADKTAKYDSLEDEKIKVKFVTVLQRPLWPANFDSRKEPLGEIMRITVSHNRSKEEVIQSVDKSFNDLFRGIGGIPVKLEQEHKNWQGSTLTFALTAKMGLLSTPIKGTVEVTDRDITIDADLGILERMIPVKKAQELVTQHVHGLLK